MVYGYYFMPLFVLLGFIGVAAVTLELDEGISWIIKFGKVTI